MCLLLPPHVPGAVEIGIQLLFSRAYKEDSLVLDDLVRERPVGA